jgi:tetratricopeptide (TPR) repeat protein
MEAYNSDDEQKDIEKYEYKRKGEKHFKLGEYQEALVNYENSITRDPEYYFAHLGKARALEALEQYPTALESYETALTLKPGSIVVLNEKVSVLTSLGQYSAALECAEQALIINPKSVDAYTGKGYVHYLLKQFPLALESYENSILCDPKMAYAHYNKGYIYLCLGDLQNASISFDKAEELAGKKDNYLKTMIFNGKGNVFFRLNQHQTSFQYFSLALFCNPTKRAMKVLSQRKQVDPALLFPDEGEDICLNITVNSYIKNTKLIIDKSLSLYDILIFFSKNLEDDYQKAFAKDPTSEETSNIKIRISKVGEKLAIVKKVTLVYALKNDDPQWLDQMIAVGDNDIAAKIFDGESVFELGQTQDKTSICQWGETHGLFTPCEFKAGVKQSTEAIRKIDEAMGVYKAQVLKHHQEYMEIYRKSTEGSAARLAAIINSPSPDKSPVPVSSNSYNSASRGGHGLYPAPTPSQPTTTHPIASPPAHPLPKMGGSST